jgi:hypothetical protein
MEYLWKPGGSFPAEKDFLTIFLSLGNEFSLNPTQILFPFSSYFPLNQLPSEALFCLPPVFAKWLQGELKVRRCPARKQGRCAKKP